MKNFKVVFSTIMMIGITLIVLKTQNTALMWWYLLPSAVILTDIQANKESKND